MTRVRYTSRPAVEGNAVKWNPAGLGECILQFDDGSATSEYVGDLEPLPPVTRAEWYAAMDAREP